MNRSTQMREKLYKTFSPQQDFSDLDHIIIGSGLGGLTAATWLAKAGKKIAVFEQHYVPGGFTHSFKRKHGFQWDVGVHYVGNVEEGNGLRTLFDFLSKNKLDWKSMGDVYDVVNIDGDEYQIKAGEEAYRQQMIRYFPEEEAAINKYLRLIKKANKAAQLFFVEKAFPRVLNETLGYFFRNPYAKYSQRTTLEILKSLTDNKRLLAVLCGQCGNYGLSPKYSSFGAHALVIAHFMEGGYFPVGGAPEIGNSIIEHLNSLGGNVYVNASVNEIVTEKNKVKGIRIGEKFIPCKSVLSNVGVNNTFNYLLSEKDRKRCDFSLKEVAPSSGHLCLYIGLDQSSEALNLPKYNTWSYKSENYDAIFDEITLENAPKQFAYISFPSAKDPEWATTHPNKATIQAISVSKYDWFKKYEETPWMKRGEEYSQLKEDFKNSMLEHLYGLFPQIKGHIISTEVSSPLTTAHFSNYKNGEIYGLAHTPERFNLPILRPETRIKGLRLVGQDITIVGVAGAMLSGMLGAITILKWRVWPIFKNMRKVDS